MYRIRKNGLNYTLIPLKGEFNPIASKVQEKAFLTITSSELEVQVDVQKTR